MDQIIDQLKVSERRAWRVLGQYRSTQRKTAKSLCDLKSLHIVAPREHDEEFVMMYRLVVGLDAAEVAVAAQ